MASTGNQDFNLGKSASKAHTFPPKLGQVNFTLMPAEPQRVGSYMTLVRRLLGSETSPFPVWTPWGAARSSEPELCDFCARSYYCHHPGVPTYNLRWGAIGTATAVRWHTHKTPCHIQPTLGPTQAGCSFPSPRQWGAQPAGVAGTPGITTRWARTERQVRPLSSKISR